MLGNALQNLNRAGHSILLFLAASGCSVNEYGTSRISRWETDTHIGYQLTAFGVHLDTRDRISSLTVGRFEAFHIFPAACDDISDVAALSTGDLFRYLRPQASIRRSLGIEIVAGSAEAGITIGFRELVRLLSLDRSVAIRRRLTVDRTDLRDSRLHFEGKCGIGD